MSFNSIDPLGLDYTLKNFEDDFEEDVVYALMKLSTCYGFKKTVVKFDTDEETGLTTVKILFRALNVRIKGHWITRSAAKEFVAIRVHHAMHKWLKTNRRH
jgi:hypothetical protein